MTLRSFGYPCRVASRMTAGDAIDSILPRWGAAVLRPYGGGSKDDAEAQRALRFAEKMGQVWGLRRK